MGLLFMIAGYFVVGSCDRKGFGRFVGERFKRLVIPSLIYMVVWRGDRGKSISSWVR
jgi:glucan biosynthesis protein C